MTISQTLLAALITAATALVAVAPVILLLLWIRDRKRGKLW